VTTLPYRRTPMNKYRKNEGNRKIFIKKIKVITAVAKTHRRMLKSVYRNLNRSSMFT
jgi:hypothetical protein